MSECIRKYYLREQWRRLCRKSRDGSKKIKFSNEYVHKIKYNGRK